MSWCVFWALFAPCRLTGFLLNSGQFNVAVSVHAEVISNIYCPPWARVWRGTRCSSRGQSSIMVSPYLATCPISPHVSRVLPPLHLTDTVTTLDWVLAGPRLDNNWARPDQDAGIKPQLRVDPPLPGPGTWVVVPRSGRCGTSSGYSGYSGSNWTHQTQSLAQMSCPTWWIP